MNRRGLGLMFGTLLLTGCAGPTITEIDHYKFAGPDGVEHWADMGPKYGLCSRGHQQSPVDITVQAVNAAEEIDFYYSPSKLVVVNTGHYLQVPYDPGNYMEIEGKKYELLQFHIHMPSEHTRNGQYAAAEIHFVHRADDGELAVVGVFMAPGKENRQFKKILENIPSEKEVKLVVDLEEIHAFELLPVEYLHVAYDGSLTIPPCSEGVKWRIMLQPIEVSHAQIAEYEEFFNGSNRSIQPLNNRRPLEERAP